MKKLMQIQAELKVSKNQYNNFGKYKYRSAEDILEAAKPLCHAHGAVLMLSDDVVNVGPSNYIKATASLYDSETGELIANASAFAREAVDKKGMDDSQISGTASSYARKYAMNGLFCIDDTKDADTNEHHNQRQNKPADNSKFIGVVNDMFTKLNNLNDPESILKWQKNHQNWEKVTDRNEQLKIYRELEIALKYAQEAKQ